jgi:hypothetical protein
VDGGARHHHRPAGGGPGRQRHRGDRRYGLPLPAGRYGPGLLAALDAVSVRLSTDALMALDAQVELDGRDSRAVARSWLREQGLLRAGTS